MNIRKVKLSLKSHKNVIFDKPKQHFPFGSQMFLNSYQKCGGQVFSTSTMLIFIIDLNKARRDGSLYVANSTFKN